MIFVTVSEVVERNVPERESRRVRLHSLPQRCKVTANERGEPVTSLWRETEETIQLLNQDRKRKKNHQDSAQLFVELGLRAVYEPFWKSLPHTDIFQMFTPDILHQLHKSVFKDHLVNWCTKIVGAAKLDARFKAMNGHAGL